MNQFRKSKLFKFITNKNNSLCRIYGFHSGSYMDNATFTPTPTAIYGSLPEWGFKTALIKHKSLCSLKRPVESKFLSIQIKCFDSRNMFAKVNNNREK